MALIFAFLLTLLLGVLTFMAYAMVFTVLLVGGVLVALCALLFFAIEAALRGDYALLLTAVVLWLVALWAGSVIARSNRGG